MAECDKCTNEKRICNLEEDGKRNSQQHKEFYDGFTKTKVEQAIAETNQGQILTILAEIKSDVNALKAKPAKRWETAIGSVLTGIIGIVLGILAGGFVK